MSSELWVLHVTAATIALGHTFIGVDHYLPFAVLGRAQNWSTPRLMRFTAICGLGHVVGSVLLGFVGIALGWAVGGMTAFESFRGSLAAWSLIGFGSLYMIWGVWKFKNNKPHTHQIVNDNGEIETIMHRHNESIHPDHKTRNTVTFWSLFILFVLGPCEALIPLLMTPVILNSWWSVASIALVFGITTILSMLVLVLFAYFGFKLPVFKKAERFSHVLAGFAIVASGLGIQLLGI